METPSIALSREFFPFTKPTKNFTQTVKEDLLRRTLSFPSSPPEERWELLLTRHTIMVKLMAEDQPAAKSLYQQDLGTCLKQPKASRT